MTEPIILKIAILLIVMLLLLGWLAWQFPLSPWLRVARRWVRFAVFSLAIGLVAKKYFFESGTLPALILAGALVYFLVETLIYYLQICAVSVSGLSPFGKYIQTESAWSCDAKMLELKRKIEAQGYKKIGAFTLEYGCGLSAKTTLFESADATTRLDVTFIPFANSYIISSSVCSLDLEGIRYLTDGNPTPFGLPFPSNWRVARKPLVCNPLKLLKIHRRLTEASRKNFAKFSVDAHSYVVETLAQVQRNAARNGFINTGIEAQESGIFSQEAKMRIWLDMIKTNYFPFLI